MFLQPEHSLKKIPFSISSGKSFATLQRNYSITTYEYPSSFSSFWRKSWALSSVGKFSLSLHNNTHFHFISIFYSIFLATSKNQENENWKQKWNLLSTAKMTFSKSVMIWKHIVLGAFLVKINGYSTLLWNKHLHNHVAGIGYTFIL